eukprot:m.24604 g.24604  ORF g.24604 m.24604 type:complete len:177 (+) comp4175_c0_seq1:316-846(+)
MSGGAGAADEASTAKASQPATGEASAAAASASAGTPSGGAAAAAGTPATAGDAKGKRARIKYTETQLKELLVRRAKEKEQLQQLETQIYAMEGSYLQDTQSWGNIFRGWDGYTSTKSQTGRTRRFKESDRLFSSSSLTAPSRKPTDNDDIGERRKRKKDKRIMEKKQKRMRQDTFK